MRSACVLVEPDYASARPLRREEGRSRELAAGGPE